MVRKIVNQSQITPSSLLRRLEDNLQKLKGLDQSLSPTFFLLKKDKVAVKKLKYLLKESARITDMLFKRVANSLK